MWLNLCLKVIVLQSQLRKVLRAPVLGFPRNAQASLNIERMGFYNISKLSALEKSFHTDYSVNLYIAQ